MIYKTLFIISFAGMLPAVVMGMAIMLIFIVDFSGHDTWMIFLGISMIIVMGIFFITNLLVPIAKNRRLAITAALPTIIVFTYFFLIRPFFTSISPDNWLEDLGFQIWWSCIFGPLIEIVLLAGMTYFGWLGTRLNLAITSKVHKLDTG
jgi:hypothetical protein